MKQRKNDVESELKPEMNGKKEMGLAKGKTVERGNGRI